MTKQKISSKSLKSNTQVGGNDHSVLGKSNTDIQLNNSGSEDNVEDELSIYNEDDNVENNELDSRQPCMPGIALQPILKHEVTDHYILHLHASQGTHPTVAVIPSENEPLKIFSLNDNGITELHQLSIKALKYCCGLKFSSDNNNLLYAAYQNGLAVLWDLRTPNNYVQRFVENSVSDHQKKTFITMDVSANNRFLAVGTELYENNSYVMFWDTRALKFCGGYWESHSDDVTQVRFHRTEPKKLLSGGSDGLINIFDLSRNSEDDALTDSLNVISGVSFLSWTTHNNTDAVYSVSESEVSDLWDIKNAERIVSIGRKKVLKGIWGAKKSEYYVATGHTWHEQTLMFSGFRFLRNMTLLSYTVDDKNQLVPQYYFNNGKQKNKSYMIRSTWLNENTNMFLCGGESGVLEAYNLGHKDGTTAYV